MRSSRPAIPLGSSLPVGPPAPPNGIKRGKETPGSQRGACRIQQDTITSLKTEEKCHKGLDFCPVSGGGVSPSSKLFCCCCGGGGVFFKFTCFQKVPGLLQGASERSRVKLARGKERKAEPKGPVPRSRADDVSHFPHLLIKILSGEANSSLK